MTDKRFRDLDSTASLNRQDIFAVEQAGNSRRVSAITLRNFVEEGGLATHLADTTPHGITAYAMTLLAATNGADALETLGIELDGNSLTIGSTIVKWGTGAVGSNSFAAPFPTSCNVVVYSLAGDIGQSDESDEIHYISAKSASGFTISVTGDHSSFPSVDYIAIGS